MLKKVVDTPRDVVYEGDIKGRPDMTKIIISKASHGWQAVFEGFATMPDGVPLPLPFTSQAPAEMVRSDLRSRFQPDAIVTKAGSR
jgi:hypothetical protein